jgi:tyrosyl-tRNA synthetase
VHGPQATEAAEQAADALFGGRVEELGAEALAALAGEVPSSNVAVAELERGIDPVALLVRAGLEPSNGAARRSLQQGGVYVNGARMAPEAMVSTADLRPGGFLLLRKGKRSYHLVRAAG